MPVQERSSLASRYLRRGGEEEQEEELGDRVPEGEYLLTSRTLETGDGSKPKTEP